MKKHLSTFTVLALLAFAGCTKQASSNTSQENRLNTGNKTDLTTPGSTFNVVDNGDGTFTATLQPDSTNGEDVHVYKRQGSPDIANTNFNDVPRIRCSSMDRKRSACYPADLSQVCRPFKNSFYRQSFIGYIIFIWSKQFISKSTRQFQLSRFSVQHVWKQPLYCRISNRPVGTKYTYLEYTAARFRYTCCFYFTLNYSMELQCCA